MDYTELQNALATLQTAVTNVEAQKVVDPLRTVVENQLLSEGWSRPEAPEVETPAEDVTDTTEA
jgi:hypothetical protein